MSSKSSAFHMCPKSPEVWVFKFTIHLSLAAQGTHGCSQALLQRGTPVPFTDLPISSCSAPLLLLHVKPYAAFISFCHTTVEALVYFLLITLKSLSTDCFPNSTLLLSSAISEYFLPDVWEASFQLTVLPVLAVLSVHPHHCAVV